VDLASIVALVSEAGIAVFTAWVAILEGLRFFQGPKISFLLPDDEEVYADYREGDNPPVRAATIEVPLVIMNSGPRGGAVAEIDLQMVTPFWQVGPTLQRPKEVDKIVVSWTLYSSREEIGGIISGSSALSIKDNESVGLKLSMNIILTNDMDPKKSPSHTLPQIEKQNPIFEFIIHYKTTTRRKRSLVSRKRRFKIRPHFVKPGDIPPKWMV
jgi:hypothetical protein